MIESPHAQSASDVLAALDVSSIDDGLTALDVEKRLGTHGENVLPSGNEKRWYAVLFAQFTSVLILILLAAALISFLLNDVKDAVIISAAVILNVIIGFIQEWKAEQSLQALQEVITPEATIIRDGRRQRIDASLLVPGDIVVITAGETIPADARILRASELEVNEAPLTGESAPVQKDDVPVEETAGVGDRHSMVHFGTQVVRGNALAIVTATGVSSEMGQIADLLSNTKDEQTPLQKRLNQFSLVTAGVILGVSLLIFGIGIAQGLEFIDIFSTAIAVAVSAIPEGLVVSLTVILALGMRRILGKKGLVRSLQAAETLGSTSVICTDKTGTITEGRMQVVDVVTLDYHFSTDESVVERHQDKALREMIFALNIGMLSNDASVITTEAGEETIIGNYTDQALLRAGIQVGLDPRELQDKEERIATLPFDSANKYMATLHDHPKDGRRIYVKGAPERVLAMCSKVRSGSRAQAFSDEQRQEFQKRIDEYTERGLRTLAFAYCKSSASTELSHDALQDMTFVGFVGIQDPLRPNIADTFQRTANAGITAVMITGDHQSTAQSIAREIGLPAEQENILTGEQLAKLSQEELNERVAEISVYARVSPADKLNIVEAWKAQGKVVAMTGDGVNDAPALKAADIGIALGSGTDVAKGTADLVLLNDDYTTIVDAVEEGRVIFDNIRKVVLYLLSDSFTEVIVIVIALLYGLPLPLTAAQILWINLVADGFPSMALTTEEKEEEVMDQPPRPLKEPVLNGEMLWIMGGISLITGILNFYLFQHVLNYSGDLMLAQTVVFMSIAIDSLPFAFAVRTLRRSVFTVSPFQNPWLIIGVGVAFVLQIATIAFPPLSTLLGVVPLGTREWLYIAGASVLVVLFTEFIKYLYNHHIQPLALFRSKK